MSTDELHLVASELSDRIRVFEQRLLALGGYCRCSIQISNELTLTFERHGQSWALVVTTPTNSYLLRDASLDIKIQCAPRLHEILPAIAEAQKTLISRLRVANTELARTFDDLAIEFPPPPAL